MCGIFGVVGHLSKNDVKRFFDLAVFNEQRGQDSWGVYINNNSNGVPYIYKALGTPSDLSPTSRRSITEHANNATVILGHTRAASCGVVNVYNAHPFRFDHIIGAHNGIIYNYKELAAKYGFNNVAVDSEIIFLLLRHRGPEALSELEGYASIWWTDVRVPNVCYLWRSHNVLSIATLKTGIIAFSSVASHLSCAGYPNPVSLDEHIIYAVDANTSTIAEVTKVRMREYAIASDILRTSGYLLGTSMHKNAAWDYLDDQYLTANYDFNEEGGDIYDHVEIRCTYCYRVMKTPFNTCECKAWKVFPPYREAYFYCLWCGSPTQPEDACYCTDALHHGQILLASRTKRRTR